MDPKDGIAIKWGIVIGVMQVLMALNMSNNGVIGNIFLLAMLPLLPAFFSMWEADHCGLISCRTNFLSMYRIGFIAGVIANVPVFLVYNLTGTIMLASGGLLMLSLYVGINTLMTPGYYYS